MRIRIGHSTAYDFKTQLYAPLRTLALPEGTALSLPHEYGAAGDCTRAYFAEGCDLFLAEVSYPSTGLGMEIAYAAVADVPIVFVHRKDCRPSSSLRRVSESFFAYADESELKQQLQLLVVQLASQRAAAE